MTTNLIDVLTLWLGSGPSSPRYCPMFGPNVERGASQFGQIVDGAPTAILELKYNNVGKLAAPLNGLLWRVPDDPPALLSDEEQATLEAAWPTLRGLDGQRLNHADLQGGDFDDLNKAVLLEVIPAAFRRLEFLFSSLEVPQEMADWDIPRVPTPRWLWIWGFRADNLRERIGKIAQAQLELPQPPGLTLFEKGLAPVLVAPGDVLGEIVIDDRVRVRAFDETGLPIDPDFVFATFARLAADSDFQSLAVPHPDFGEVYAAAPRQVFVVSDQVGAPYVPRPAPQPPPFPGDPEFGAIEAGLSLLTVAPGTGSQAIPEHGVVVLEGPNAMAEGRTALAMTGTHVRLGTHPHGDAGASISVDLAASSFLRLQVQDYRTWFARNPNPRNRLTRYSEGNLLTPLIDGAAFFRELHRTVRATYKTIDTTAPAASFDPFAPAADLTPTAAALGRVYLLNAWIEPYAETLGRRGLLAAPRVQATAPEALPDLNDLLGGLHLVPAAALPDVRDVAGETAGERLWWLVSDAGLLPPGAAIEIRQLLFAEAFHGDDPRLPGFEPTADVFGIVAPFPDGAGNAFAFASGSGRIVLPFIFADGREPKASLRVTLWPAEGADPVFRAYDGAVLDEPSHATAPKTLDPALAGLDIRLVYEGHPGEAFVALRTNSDAAYTVAAVNQRSGEVMLADAPAHADLRIALSGVAQQDRILVGFLAPGDTDPALAPCFVQLCLGAPELDDPDHPEELPHPGEAAALALAAGKAPAHPTEFAGLLREATAAGVDVRLLGWRDPTQDVRAALLSTRGMVNAINASFDGRRGQAMWDATTREVFLVHHQKASFVRTAKHGVTAFLGGIDIRPARWDTPAHRNPNVERPSGTWHDVQCKIEGKAAWDVYRNFQQRWNAVNALPDIVGSDPGRAAVPAPDDPAWGPTLVVDDPLVTKADGPHAVQIVRTLTRHLPALGGSAPPFDVVDAATGDLSVKAAWQAIIAAAKQYIYIEEQYFWIKEHALALHRWLAEDESRFLFLLTPRRFDDIDKLDQIHYMLRRTTINLLWFGTEDTPPAFDVSFLREGLPARTVIFHLLSADDFDPIYVHAKLVIADDAVLMIGSANLTRRSWTLDSEINAVCLDSRLRRGGRDAARRLRVDLLGEHLGLRQVEKPLIEDPRDAFRILNDALDGKRPWMRTHVIRYDPLFTHYGPLPAGFDPRLSEAIAAVVDPDGTRPSFETGLIDFATYIAALRDARGGATFGGFGRLRLTFDVSALGVDPAEVTVRAELGPEDPVAERVEFGPWPADRPAEFGLVQIGKTYSGEIIAIRGGLEIGHHGFSEPATATLTEVSVRFEP